MPVRTEDISGGDRNPIGGNWTPTLTGSAGVTGGLAGPPANTSDLFGDYRNDGPYGDDQYAQCVMHNASGMPFASTGGPAVRCSGSAGAAPAGNANGYFMYYGVTVTQLTKVVNGSETLVASVVQSASNDSLDYVEARGTTLKLFRNGAQLGSNLTDSGISSGAPGLIVQGSGGQLDTWEGGDFAPTVVPGKLIFQHA